MYSSYFRLLVAILLITTVYSQTNFRNTCQNSSLLPLLATGAVNLNPLDTYNSGANKNYYVDISLAQFQTVDVLGYGFALSGFQANCGQSYYTLVVDKVAFENQNTRMRITVNFLNPSTFATSTVITNWNFVSFTYIVVSRNFQNTFTNIWATTAEISLTRNIVGEAIDSYSNRFDGAFGTSCQVYSDPNLIFPDVGGAGVPGLRCNPGAFWSDPANLLGGQLVYHAYIMGFQWNSNRSTTAFLNASIFAINPEPAFMDSFNAESIFTITLTNIAGTAGGGQTGPLFWINSMNGALQYLKVAIVVSVFDAFFKPTQGPAQLTPSIYNLVGTGRISALPYSSSYVFTQVTRFNVSNPIVQGTSAQVSATNGPITWNQHYMRLPDARYAIYGLTGFSFPKNINSTCTSTLWINSTLNSINTYTVNTPNANPTAVYFSADIFTQNVGTLCTPLTPGTSPYVFLNNIGKKSYFTVPTQSLQQYIQEWFVPCVGSENLGTPANPIPNCVPTANIDPTASQNLNFAGVSTQSQMDPSNTANIFSAAQEAVYLQYYGANNGNNDTILFRAEIPYQGLTVGAPVKLEFGYFDGPWPIGATAIATPNRIGMIDGRNYSIQVTINGFVVYQDIYTAGPTVNPPAPAPALVTTKKIYVTTATDNGGAGSIYNRVNQIFRGININSTTATVTITVSYVRSKTQDQNLFTYVVLSQYLQAYDPNTGCCVSSCPANTGLDATITPPTCVYCNTQAGLFYNPNNGSCTCLPGFYLDSNKTFQCYACSALYCSICNPNNPAQCFTCATGAVLNNVTSTCTCSNGYFVNGTTCQQCPYQCQTCTSPNGACATCVDSQRRDIAQGCKCIAGFYDSGSVNCTACSATCLTCINGAGCSSCDATKFRNLTGSLCTCFPGYYEFYNVDQSRICKACSPECLTCSVAPTSCTSCDTNKNRVAGVDSQGHQTCICNPGFYATPDGSCVQSNCNTDPFCAQCEQGLKLCVQCQASKNRIIKLPQSICVCMDGYYADTNNNCVPCATGCGICSSATNCSSCVTLATNSPVAGQCNCPSKTYFTVSVDGVRYCAACGPYCSVCVDANTCTTCLKSFTKTVDNQCVCATQNFINAAGQCVPCATGCQTCTSATSCTKCIDPLVLQGSVCQANCNDGFTPLGSICKGCPDGCLQCTQNFVCFYCKDGLYMYNGACYSVCPAGTIGDSSAANWNCVPCNSPCQTCMNHPSYCTSCQNGQGYLQTSGISQSCVQTCNDGTYANNGVCSVCDFSCATCLGSATNCISCPAGQLLYQGGCWATCPAILVSGTGGSSAACVEKCPDGFYKVSNTQCAPCSPQCTTCSAGPDNCTSCLQGSVSLNGTCTTICGENQFSFQGICVACSSSCYGCSITPTNCKTCASGYVKSGSICQRGCQTSQFFDNDQSLCVNCPANCATCSSFNFCTSCKNVAITPRGGVCSNCPYPCSTCDGTGACTSCLSGFYYFNNQCQTTCPQGARPLNGICQCISGIVSNGNCVTSCQAGSTAINGACVSCNSNCATCSGNTNNCTSCLSGFRLDATTKKCVSSSQCPYGQEFANGNCQNICNSGFFFYENICIYGGCFNGYGDNGFGGCVRKSVSSSSNIPTCPAGQFLLNSTCVNNCGSGYFPDNLSQKCLACSANCVACFNSGYCINCRNGFQPSNGGCSPVTSCASNQVQYNNNCLASCPIGTYQIGQQCQRSCPTNTYFSNQICFLSCPSGLRTNDACVNTCPAGTKRNNGVCA